jgi:transcriptional regulator with XRE-family HTH domain
MRARRRAPNLTQEAAGERVHMDMSYWGRIERGKIDPGLGIKLTLASQKRSVSVADYHRQCWLKMEQAIKFAQNVGGGLERIEVSADAAIAELRRRHLPPEGG